MALGPQQRDAATLVVDGVEYAIEPDLASRAAMSLSMMRRSITRDSVPTQPGDPGVEFERRLENLALGWGQSKYTGPGGYDYAISANLHRMLSWLPGSAVTDRTNATVPIGPVSFCEYWDGTAANRRLIIVTPRHIYEVDPSGSVVANDLGVGFTLANGCTWGVNYRAGGMSAPKVFIARASNTSTDYMVRRTAANTYSTGGANTKFAAAVGKGKDSAGADVLWRINENGKMNQSLADNDPNADASWSAASYPNSLYPLGDTSTRVNSLVQQNRSMVAGKVDGAWTFDNVLNTIPVTPGMEQTMDPRNFMWFKDANGVAVAPTAQGIIWIDGLQWSPCGPVSSNPDARHLRGTETAVSAQVGNYIYASVYSGTTSYIFLGLPRAKTDTGSGRFSWHGPIATIAKKATDLRVSTVYGTRLWIGYTDDGGTNGGWATIDLNSDFTPATDLATGYIYLPEGVLDMSGPGVIKDLRKIEFIAPADKPFSGTNQWSAEVDVDGSGSWLAVDGGAVAAGVAVDRFFSTERSSKRPRIRLVYSGNTGAGELEQAIVRGTERPETTDLYGFRVRTRNSARMPNRKALPRGGQNDLEVLRGKVDSGRVAAVVFNGASFSARIISVNAIAMRPGALGAPTWTTQITMRRVKVA